MHVAMHEIANLPVSDTLLEMMFRAAGIGVAVGHSKEVGENTLFLTIVLAEPR
jgi:hypothetical protein